MEPKEFELLDRYSRRLEQCLEPCKLLRYLDEAGVLDEDDVEDVRSPNGARSTRIAQVQILLDILKRRENGLKHFIKALLNSKTQDYLGRELLEDDHFTDKEVTAFINETESELDETRTMKLKLLEQFKKHEGARSSRSSVALSDSGCDPDERVDHDDGEVVEFLVRELERERKLRQDAENAQRAQQRKLGNLVKKQGRSLSELGKNWSLFRSVGLLSTLSEGEDKVQPGPMYRSASWNSLTNDRLFAHSGKPDAGRDLKREKWPNNIDEQSGDETDSDESSREEERINELAGRVANLEQELEKEKALRQRSEKEILMLCQEKEELCEELDETRYQLHMSLQDLRFDGEDELGFAESEGSEYDGNLTDNEDIPTHEASRRCPNIQVLPSSSADGSSESTMDCRPFSASREYYSLTDISFSNQLGQQSAGLKRVSSSWFNLNVQHYELDNYDSEIEMEQEKTPLNFLETLRKLRLRTKSLYENAVNEGKDLELLRNKVGRSYSPPKKSAPARRHTVWFF